MLKVADSLFVYSLILDSLKNTLKQRFPNWAPRDLARSAAKICES